ncbi:MAG: flagellar biosynthesis protein FlhF [Phycisphaerae bacterium]|nr:flagellar biosynthesis protein FlhF [Phycisphaerae bacterium]
MEAKTYCACTMAEALADVKRDLGRDAVILHTRSFRKGGWLGLGGRPMWEVIASSQVNVPQRLPSGRYVPMPKESAASIAQAPAAAQPLGQAISRTMAELHGMVAALLTRSVPVAIAQRPLSALAVAGGEAPEALAAWRTHLLRRDVAEETVTELLGEVAREMPASDLCRPVVVRERLVTAVASRLPAADVSVPQATGRPRVMVLVGPTGVGKTTTIAKLAARFRLAERRRVGLVTIDTYRIAAVDQLKTYAQILEVPLRTVLRPGELAEALAQMAGLDVVLIDTAGRSPADAPRLGQMKAFLDAAHADEVHLVVSATAGRACAARVVESFAVLAANRWILSKLDEVESFGAALSVAGAIKMPMSFVTTGQEVPDDIAPANPRKLAELIVGEAVAYGG